MAQDNKNIKSSVLSGLFWTYGERFLAQGVSFIVSLVLARMLTPTDYGVIAIIMVFISISDVFISCGLGTSLIQKKDADELDFSSIFYAGLVMAVFFYAVMYGIAPWIEMFYEMPGITIFIRVLSLRIPIGAINTIQHAYVSRHMMFKKFFFSTLIGTIISAVIGIVMATMGFGTWALIAQSMTNTVIDTCVLFITVPWRPRLMFSMERCRKLFAFGWKITLAQLIQVVYNNLRGLAIGKKYTPEDLAYYDRGQSMTNIIVNNIDTSLSKVLFPVMSNHQDNKAELKNITRRSIKTSTFVMAPLLMGLAMTAPSLIEILLTEKWLPAVPYLQILCMANLFQPIHMANLQAIKALGRSDVNLRLEIIKKSYSVVILAITIICFNDPFAVAVGFVISTFISVFVNAFPNKQLLDYGYGEQLIDITPVMVITLAMGGIVWLMGYLPLSLLPKLIVQVICGMSVYMGLSAFFKIEAGRYIIGMINGLMESRNKGVK